MIAHRFARTPILRLTIRRALAGAAFGALTLTTAAKAAETSERMFVWTIPVGDLAAGVDSLARQAGVSLSYDASLLAGKHTQGVQGSYSASQALSRLLAGSGLQAQALSGSSYLLTGGGDAGAAMQLGAVAINADVLGSVTEHSNSYTTGAISIGKTPQSLRRTPQSVTVLTTQRLEDQHLTNLTQMLNQTPGVVVDYTDSERVTYWSRGYQIDAIQFDGARINQNAGNGNFIQPDAATIDHVEVLRGASGMLRGSGNPSGTVNIVRKRPTADFQITGSYTVGSWDANRYTADISGPLTEGGAVRGRMIAVHDDSDSFQDSRMERKSLLYGVVAADLDEATTATVGMEYVDLNATGAWGNLPANFDGSPLSFSRSTFLGADWARWDRTDLHVFSELEHRFQNDWNLKLSASHARFAFEDHGFQQTYLSRTSTTNPYLFNASATLSDGGGETLYDNFGAVLDGPFRLFGREHHLTVGSEYNRVDQTGIQSTSIPLGSVDIRTWDPKSITLPNSVDLANAVATSVTTEKAIYGTFSFSLADPLTAQLGARLNWWNSNSETAAGATTAYKVTREVVPYAALIYDLNDNISVYGNYTEIFSPQTSYDSSGSLLDPMTGDTYEMGIKGEFYEGRLNASAAVFRTTLSGKALDDVTSDSPCLPYYTSGYCKVAGGKSRAKGYELEISGEVLPDWQVGGGYTYTTTEYLKDTTTNTGNVIRSTDPKQMLRLFTSYKLPGELSKLTVGGGLQAQSDAYATSGTARAEQGGYAVYNAMLKYRFNDKYSVQFNANNLFDKYYYKKIGATGVSYYYGDPRNFSLTLSGAF
jgi:outer membrane receptor for ferric coprogen and ferric-rhodotorulic acid